LDEEGVAIDVVLPLLGALKYLHKKVSRSARGRRGAKRRINSA